MEKRFAYAIQMLREEAAKCQGCLEMMLKEGSTDFPVMESFFVKMVHLRDASETLWEFQQKWEKGENP